MSRRRIAATANYAAGDIRGNFAVVKRGQSAATNELSVYSFGQTHLVAFRSEGNIAVDGFAHARCCRTPGWIRSPGVASLRQEGWGWGAPGRKHST